MTQFRAIALAPLLTALAACQSPEETPAGDSLPEAAAPEVLAVAALALPDGEGAGHAELLAQGDEVSISVILSGLPAGTRAVHVHTTGSCEAPDFASAGGHLNPGMNEHGTENPNGAHLGDLPNALIADDGIGTVSTTLRGTRDEVLAAIFDEDGSAIVVHEGEDDNMTDPTGNAGSRLACGVIEAPQV